MDKLPENWFIKITNENKPYIQRSNVIHHLGYNYTIGGYYGNHWYGSFFIPDGTEITFEDFKKLVLKEDNMKELKITEEKVKETIKNHPEARGVLESLFPEIVETTYKVGDRFNYHGGNYLLARVDTCLVNLFDLKNGNRWGEPIKVDSSLCITEYEFSKFGLDKSRLAKII